MYRLLAGEHGEVRERRAQLEHSAIYARQGSRWWAKRLGLETKRLRRRDA